MYTINKKCEIPYELYIYVVKQNIWDTYYSDKTSILPTYIISKEKPSASKKDTIYYRLKSYCNYINKDRTLLDNEIKELSIKNKHLELGVTDNTKVTFDKEGLVSISVTNEEIRKHVNYTLGVNISVDNFFDLLKCSNNYITNGLFHGYYYFDNYKVSGTNSYKSAFVLDDKDTINDDVQKGVLLAKQKKTTNYIPGHKYLLKNRDEIIYLGPLNEFKKSGSYSSSSSSVFYGTNFLERISEYETVKKTRNLKINFTLLKDRCREYYENVNIHSFIELCKGQNCEVFLPNLLEFIITLPATDYVIQNILSLCFSVEDTNSSGVDLGEFFVVDPMIDNTDVISDYCNNNYKRNKVLFSGIKFKTGSMDSEVKSEVIKCYTECIKTMIKNIFSRSYSITADDTKKLKEKSGSDLIKFLTTSFSSSYYLYPLNNLIKNKIIDLTEEEIISIVDKAKELYLKG